MPPIPPDQEWKKGSAELLVLSLLEDQPRHGYDISKLIQIRSGGALQFHVTSLYPLLYPAGEAWVGRWALGGEGGAAKTALLHPDSRRAKSASFTSEELEGVCCRHQPGCRNRTCLTLRRSFKNGSPPCVSKQPRSQI